MEENIGIGDRIIRASVAIMIGFLHEFGYVGDLAETVLGPVALILILNSFFGFCPVYWFFRYSTQEEGTVSSSYL